MKKTEAKIKTLLIVFMIIQPILDNYLLYSDEVIDFFGFSPTTILRIVLLGLIGIYLYFQKENSQSRKVITIYAILVIIYSIIHHIIGSGIDNSLISSNFKYNIFEELFYLVRMILPFVTAYIVYCLKLTKEEFKEVIVYTSLVISIIMLSLNLFGVAKTSYFDDFIEGNFFKWHDSKIDRYMLASKGWFNSANQIGGLLLILLSLLTYYVLEDKKTSDLIILCMLILSSFAIGTRTASLGVIVILVITFIVFILFKIIKKKSFNKREVTFSSIIAIFSLLVFTYAPIVNCTSNNYKCILHIGSTINDISNKGEKLNDIEYDGSPICSFIKKTSTDSKYFKNIYPCEENINFWTSFVDNRTYTNMDNRLIETLIMHDVYSKIDTSKVNYFGMSRSRLLSAEFYLEKDIIVHYYTLGILGLIIFIFPYILCCAYIGIKSLIKKTLSPYYISLILSIMLPIAISVLTGHILDELIVSIYLGFILGYLLSLKGEDY